MNTVAVLILIAAVAVVLIVAAVIVSRRRRSEHLRATFGPEYDRAVREQGDPSRAETVLLAREERVEKFQLRTLPGPERERYAEEWAGVQRLFIDDPAGAVAQSDRLVTRVMEARGYPTGDFEQRAADVSVHYPVFVQNYRAAREITQRQAAGRSSTEDLRRAMVYFRSLFEELLEVSKPQEVEMPARRLAS